MNHVDRVVLERHPYAHNIAHAVRDFCFSLYVVFRKLDLLGRAVDIHINTPPGKKSGSARKRSFPPAELLRLCRTMTSGQIRETNDTPQDPSQIAVSFDGNVKHLPFYLPWVPPEEHQNLVACTCSHPACTKDHYIRMSLPRYFEYVGEYSNHLLSSLGIEIPPKPDKIVVVRREHTRRIRNHDDLVSNLEQLGYEVVSAALEDLPLRDQMKLMRQSKAVVAMHGAALVHTLFVPKGSVVLEILPYGFGGNKFECIAMARNQPYLKWQCRDLEKTFPSSSKTNKLRNQDLIVDCDAISDLLEPYCRN